MSVDNQDPKISAGELRAMGIAVPDGVPDCGWIRRGDVRYSVDTVMGTHDVLTMDIRIEFTAPFRWIEVPILITR